MSEWPREHQVEVNSPEVDGEVEFRIRTIGQYRQCCIRADLEVYRWPTILGEGVDREREKKKKGEKGK
jgi:hypothetical protein